MRKTWSTIVTAVSLADGSLGKGMKWAAFEKPVHYGQNDRIALGGREGSDEIERDVGPGSRRDRQRLK